MMAHAVAGAQTPATAASHQPNVLLPDAYGTGLMRSVAGGAIGVPVNDGAM